MSDNTTDLRPKTYIAVEIPSSLTVHEVAEIVIRAGKAVGVWFRRLESIGLIDMAARKFVRFRIDLDDPKPVLRHVLDQGFGVIYLSNGNYRVYLPPRVGFVNVSTMMGTPESNVRLYKGPKIKGWEDAFAKR